MGVLLFTFLCKLQLKKKKIIKFLVEIIVRRITKKSITIIFKTPFLHNEWQKRNFSHIFTYFKEKWESLESYFKVLQTRIPKTIYGISLFRPPKRGGGGRWHKMIFMHRFVFHWKKMDIHKVLALKHYKSIVMAQIRKCLVVWTLFWGTVNAEKLISGNFKIRLPKARQKQYYFSYFSFIFKLKISLL